MKRCTCGINEACYMCPPAGSAEPNISTQSTDQPDVSKNSAEIDRSGGAGKELEARLVGAPGDAYSPEDMAFYRFWYSHMTGDVISGPVCGVSHRAARYIWDAALATAPAPITDEQINALIQEANRIAFDLTAKLCAIPVVTESYGHELIRRESMMELVTQWRMKWDAAQQKEK